MHALSPIRSRSWRHCSKKYEQQPVPGTSLDTTDSHPRVGVDSPVLFSPVWRAKTGFIPAVSGQQAGQGRKINVVCSPLNSPKEPCDEKTVGREMSLCSGHSLATMRLLLHTRRVQADDCIAGDQSKSVHSSDNG